MLDGERACSKKHQMHRQWWSPEQRRIGRTFFYWKQKLSMSKKNFSIGLILINLASILQLRTVSMTISHTPLSYNNYGRAEHHGGHARKKALSCTKGFYMIRLS
jgi:site-specific recombinase